MTMNKAVFRLLLMGLLCLFCTEVSAESYLPSVTPQKPVITEATDANGNDVTDLLVVTPYVERGEMQDYKVEHFEVAYGEMSWEMIAEVLEDTLTPEMNYRNLMVERLFYIHERDDMGIVELPATVKLATNIPKNQYCEVITFWEDSSITPFSPNQRMAPAPTGIHAWQWIPSVNNGDGTITVEVDHYGPYATVFYRVQENPTTPDTPGAGGAEGGDSQKIPHSPQTGEPENLLPLLFAAALTLAGKCWLNIENQ